LRSSIRRFKLSYLDHQLEKTVMPRAYLIIGWTLLAAVANLAGADKDDFKLSKEEQQVLDLTNAARAKEKLPALKADPLLCKAARAHSANMAKQKKLAHELDGKDGGKRIDATGYDWAVWGENVGSSEELAVKEVFDGWMASKDHRVNILKDKFKEIGIGLAKDEKGEWYYTQVFGTPRKK